jgi:hypothetical protein
MSATTIRIKPKPGLIVRDPVTFRPLAPEGEDKPRFDQYWQRRLRDGDVVKVEAEPVDKGTE